MMRIKSLLSGGAGLLLAHAAYAGQLPQSVIDCRSVTGAEQRLECYDNLVDDSVAGAATDAESSQPVVSTEDSPPSGAVVTGSGTSPEALPVPAAAAPAPSPQAAQSAPEAIAEADVSQDEISPEALFGKSGDDVRQTVQKATGSEEIDELSANIVKLQYTATGKVVITLDNGQVWVQIDTYRSRLRENDTVVIRRATLGSFLLTKAGSKRSIRVKRAS